MSFSFFIVAIIYCLNSHNNFLKAKQDLWESSYFVVKKLGG